MAIYHCSIKIISRGGRNPRSAVASAAYRSGTKMTNEYDGIMHDYTRKRGVVYSEVMLPPHAPGEFSERSILWNSVEDIEKSSNAQLAREVEVSLPRELGREQQVQLVRDYVGGSFVPAGMCADFSIHDRQDGNPHAHIMLTVRPLQQSGEWGAKCRKEYILDKDGNRIKKADGKYRSRRADATDWNGRGKAEEWRKAWADCVNHALTGQGIQKKVDHRSYKRQGVEQIPAVHMGVAASQMERRGTATGRGRENRQIRERNRLLEETEHKTAGLSRYLKGLCIQKEEEGHRLATPAEVLDAASQQAAQRGMYPDAEKFADGAAFLRENGIVSLPELQEKVAEMWKRCDSITGQIKKAEKSCPTCRRWCGRQMFTGNTGSAMCSIKRQSQGSRQISQSGTVQGLHCMAMQKGIC